MKSETIRFSKGYCLVEGDIHSVTKYCSQTEAENYMEDGDLLLDFKTDSFVPDAFFVVKGGNINVKEVIYDNELMPIYEQSKQGKIDLLSLSPFLLRIMCQMLEKEIAEIEKATELKREELRRLTESLES